MAKKVINGLDILLNDPERLQSLGNRVGYLGHEASVTRDLIPGYLALSKKIGKRLVKLFGPQHGFQTIDQDNMIETAHQNHPLLTIPVYSLYSETRKPTAMMIKDLDTLVIDLQDVGTRVYTYIWTLRNCLEACAEHGVTALVLDRPNPAGGLIIEGNQPLPDWYSFVCMEDIPMRHGLTIAEMAMLLGDRLENSPEIHVIRMEGWKRSFLWKHTRQPWINPSPNLATPESTLVYPGTVLIEGTQLSEGRGTTRSLEQFGHPAIRPFDLLPKIEKSLKQANLSGISLRPVYFKPTFDKHQGQNCGGFFVHVTNPAKARPWMTMQIAIKVIYQEGIIEEFWNKEPYEYKTDAPAMDYINGNPAIRKWIEEDGRPEELRFMQDLAIDRHNDRKQAYLVYE